MTTQTMTDSEIDAWKARYKGRCGDCQAPCETTAKRCMACHLENLKTSNKRRKGDGIQHKHMLSMTLTHPAKTEAVQTVPQVHAHHYKLPSVSDGNGLQVGVCVGCGHVKEHRPWDEERKWGGG